MTGIEAVVSDAKAEKERERHVTVKVDGKEKTVLAGKYVVSQFKKLVGVADDRELNIVRDHKLHPLDDAETITVHEGEIFVSAPRCGGSS